MSHTVLKEYEDVKVFRVTRRGSNSVDDDDPEEMELLSKLSSIEISPLGRPKIGGDFVVKIVDCERADKEVLVLEERLSKLEINFVASANNELFKSKRTKGVEVNRVNIKMKGDKRVYYVVEMTDKENYCDFLKCIHRISEANVSSVYSQATRSKRTIAQSASSAEIVDKSVKKARIIQQEEDLDVIEVKVVAASSNGIKKANESDALEEIMASLEDAIRQGYVKLAMDMSKKLAELKADLKIELKPTSHLTNGVKAAAAAPAAPVVPEDAPRVVVLVTVHRASKEETLEFPIVDQKEYKVAELKSIIDELWQIKPVNQMIVINEFVVQSDSDSIGTYERVSRVNTKPDQPSCSSSASASTDQLKFEVHVFDTSQNEQNDLDHGTINCVLGKQSNENAKEDLKRLQELSEQEITENVTPFDCAICLDDDVPPGSGIVLKECLHTFCKECIRSHIMASDDPTIKCPYSGDYNCDECLLDREIRTLLLWRSDGDQKKGEQDLMKYQMKCLTRSEATMQNVFHCKTPDCIGFGVCEDNLNFFDCPVCEQVSCLRCGGVIHMGKTCKEYQEDLKISAINDKNAKKNQDALEELIKSKKAMHCPGCKIVLCKQAGCDWIMCAMCKIEICWATRGPRWGPKGRGDTSGGCKCNFGAGKPCAPNCLNCH